MILIKSAAGLWGRVGMPAYSITKSALSGFAKFLAKEGENHGIHVNCIAPVAATRAWDGQNVPEALTLLMTAEYVAETVALFALRSCSVKGELFHSVGQHLSRIVVGQTRGNAFESAEVLLSGFEEVMDVSVMDLPEEANKSGAGLPDACSSVRRLVTEWAFGLAIRPEALVIRTAAGVTAMLLVARSVVRRHLDQLDHPRSTFILSTIVHKSAWR